MVEIVQFPTNTQPDVPTVMEKTAQNLRDEKVNIERGACILMEENGDLRIYSWGKGDNVEAVGMFSIAIHALCKGAMR